MTMVAGHDAVRTAVTAAQEHGRDRARMLRPRRGEAVTGRRPMPYGYSAR
jgi:hypothetical protein